MSDQPQTQNAARISAMLQDLATQKSTEQSAPAPAAPRTMPPPNLPMAPKRPSQVHAPTIQPTPPPRPTQAPMAPRAPTSAVAPMPTMALQPPPAPRETPVSMPPIPKPPIPPPSAAPITPPSPAVSTELRTMSADIGNIKIGQAPQGIKPPMLQPSAPAPTVIVPPPATSKSGVGRKALYGVLTAVILVGIVYSIVSLLGDPDTAPTTTNTPSTSVSPTETLGGKNLRSYFGNPASTITLDEASTASGDFKRGLVSIQPTAKLGTAISIVMDGTTQNGTAIIKNLLGNAPSSLAPVIGSDWLAIVYGQTEVFSDSGVRSETTTVSPKTVFIFEVTDVSGANQAMLAWENAGLASSSASLFGYDTSRRLVDGFTASAYRTIPVRYWNFPYADRSIDYSLVTASNNKNYLILSSSRESVFFVIDQLMQ